MTVIKSIKYLVVIFFITNFATAQTSGAIGTWTDHVCYRNGNGVAEVKNKIFCSSTNGIFSYNKTDQSIERLSKCNGLSDFGIKTIKYNDKYDVLLIAYQNSNVDLIKGNTIINISDIKRKEMAGSKTINSILFIDKLAYLSCSFGIVVLDIVNLEIKETYYIGDNGDALSVNDLTTDLTNLYAATDAGIRQASLSSNLVDFNSWTFTAGASSGMYNAITLFNNKLVISKQNTNSSGIRIDSIYYNNNNTWVRFDSVYQFSISSFTSTSNHLFVNAKYSFYSYDLNFKLNDVGWGWHNLNASILDKDGTIWLADNNEGLINYTKGSTIIIPNGPVSSNVTYLASLNNVVWVAPGGRNSAWGSIYCRDGISYYKDNKWSKIKGSNYPAIDTINDINTLVIDPSDNSHAYGASWGNGLVEFKNFGEQINVYNFSNTDSIITAIYPKNYMTRIGGMTYDNNGNLWFTNDNVTDGLVVRTFDNKWYNYPIGTIFKIGGDISNLVIDDINQKWIILPRGTGVLVYNDNNTLDNKTDDQAIVLNNNVGNGGLPSSSVFSIAKDKEGEIWVGTDAGIGVFYNPEKVFTGKNFDSKQITLQQDGHTQYLLSTEQINVIAIDGANRKWIGTNNSGAYLMSADGTKQIYHFTSDSTPLLSNTVTAITIDNTSGEVFFGTDKGIVSFHGTATEGTASYSDIYAYPNPVKPNYDGVIAIKGLVANVNVKITDISGVLIYETTAFGGQAIWNGRSFNGDKAHAGVYLVFCSNPDGSQTQITKILVLN